MSTADTGVLPEPVTVPGVAVTLLGKLTPSVPYSKTTPLSLPCALTAPSTRTLVVVSAKFPPILAVGSVNVRKLCVPLTVVPPALVATMR